MSEIGIPEEPKGVGSIIRVVFKEPLEETPETFYVGVAPDMWVEYGIGCTYEFTWQHLLQIIECDEAEEFEIVYEGFGATEKYDEAQSRAKDLFWREVL